ncbi:MAG: DUF2238 domain-containing protein [Nitrospira sp.]|nr:DUF2238 domain-containing protein [Nitrospira sp.]
MTENQNGPADRQNGRILVANSSILAGMLSVYAGLWIAMAIDPIDRADWLVENILSLALIALLTATYRRFELSLWSYLLITAFLALHTVGAHYTYAKVPAGFWVQDLLHLSRNPFDRMVHGAYGLLLVYPIREVLVRLTGLKGFWADYLPVSMVLAQSGLFEVIEALVASRVSPELGAAYLGTQGDEWDAQKDMVAALLGAIATTSVTRMVRTFCPPSVTRAR